MRIAIDGLTVYFPYPRIYPEQYEYMCHIKRTIDSGGHAILEMPSAAGRTVALLSLLTSYHLQRPQQPNLIYCTRNVADTQAVLEELRVVIRNRDLLFAQDNPSAASRTSSKFLALGLSNRKNLCLHPEVSRSETREDADAACRSLSASWLRSSPQPPRADPMTTDDTSNICQYYEGFERHIVDSSIPPGVYTLDDLLTFGKSRKCCPYYTARHFLSSANVLVYNYQYLLDPKIASLVSQSLSNDSIVVFDDAHNIDNICRDSLTVSIRELTLRRSLANLNSLRQAHDQFQTSDPDRIDAEYKRLVTGNSTDGYIPKSHIADLTLANPAVQSDILKERVPGNIRRVQHFINFLRRLIQYIRDRKMSGRESRLEQPARFLYELRTEMQEDDRPLRFCSDRLRSLMNTFKIADSADFTPLQLVADFATMLGTYGHSNSFGVVFEPVDDRQPNIPDPVIQLACLDASLAIRPVFARFRSVVLTSETISPMSLFAKMLSFQPKTMHSFSLSIQRQAMCPMIVSRGPDQTAITSRFESKMDTSVVRNYGNLAVEMASVIPDGMVIFFTSYPNMEEMVSMWSEMGIINRLFERKLVFIETPGSMESGLTLDRYRRACDTGRGAVFFCVTRGKVAEGVDFDRHYGRAVLFVGVPFQYTESRVLRARLEYMRSALDINEGDYLSFDAMRQTAQCAGRVLRSKKDYGVVVFADKRYVRADKRNKLPKWMLDLMPESQIDLDSTSALSMMRAYVRSMAQPLVERDMEVSLLTEEQVREREAGQMVEAAR